MLSTVAIFKMNFTKSVGAAKAHIRYIQHRPGRTAEHAHAKRGQRADFCCGAFDHYSRELGLPIERFNPADYIFHSRYCEIFNPYSRFCWSPPSVREIASQPDTVVPAPKTSSDNTATAKRNGNERITRTLFGRDGVMERQEAYRMLDSAEKSSVFYRIIISPDPNKEDTRKDLRLRDITEQTMHAFEDHIHKHIAWVGAVHADHTNIRHVHVLAVVTGRIPYQEFRSLPQVLIQEATRESLTQRRQLDQMFEARLKEQEREEAEWERER